MADQRPFQMQRNPSGLVDLLGMQSVGNAPHELLGAIQAGVDITDLYAIDRLQRGLGSTIAIAGIGFFVAGATGVAPFLEPPPGEMWMLYGLHASTGALPAATALRLALTVRRVSLSSNAQILTDPQLVTGPAAVGFGRTWERPLLLRPGDQLGAYCNEVTGVPATSVFIAAFYVPVRV